LLVAAPSFYVANLLEQSVKDSHAWGILQVSKHERLFDTEMIHSVTKNECIDKRFEQRHQNDSFTFTQHVLYTLNRRLVDMEALNAKPLNFVHEPDHTAHTLSCDTCVHFL